VTIVVIGGGWAGCAAALTARHQGARVLLLERTDMLLGTGLVGGIFRNNGRFTATEEMIALGAGELFSLMERCSLHRGVNFPGHSHASLYNVVLIEPMVRRYLQEAGVEIHLVTRITDVEIEGRRIRAVLGKCGKDQQVRFAGDAFVEATGTGGPPAQCNRHGNGCAMCILRCHSFGGRVSIAAKIGIQELSARTGNRLGAMSGSCKLLKASLSASLVQELNSKGVVIVPLPPHLRSDEKLRLKACQQYSLEEFQKSLILLDTGHAKLMTPFFPLEILRQVPGFENARYGDPYSGGLGNSIRFIGVSPRDDTLKVEGVDNLFCAGEKAGLFVGHTEAICTGSLAGFNAARIAKSESPLILPDSLAVGYAIRFAREQMNQPAGLSKRYTFSGSILFEAMKSRGLYTTDPVEIRKRVEVCGLTGILGGPQGGPPS
jgi:hypothetical protein